MDLGEHIRTLRKKQGLPLRKLAAKLDIDTSTLSKIERNERPISIEMVKVLSEELKVDYKELQIEIIKFKVLKDFKSQIYLKEALIKIVNEL